MLFFRSDFVLFRHILDLPLFFFLLDFLDFWCACAVDRSGLRMRLNLEPVYSRQLKKRIVLLTKMKACHLHYLVVAMIEQSSFTLHRQQKDSWKAELKEFSIKNGYDLNRNGDSGPLLLDVLEGFLKFENLSQTRGPGRRITTSESDSMSSHESRNSRRPSSSVVGGLPPIGRSGAGSQASDSRRVGSSLSGYRKDEYSWRYDGNDLPEDVMRTSAALENLQLDRKARNLTSSWRHGGDGIGEDDSRGEHM
ncbi:Protein TONNEAU 1b [Cucurbita argyrosperma subsp. argyrosperma]|nr:Protein TONNEAU 1b [Cucurbita argyrosperma subsp. argyrosperma]